MRVARLITLTEEQRSQLQSYARGRKVARRLVERASMILLAAESKENLEIAEELKISRHTVARWRERFLELGIQGLEKDAPRPGRTPRLDIEEIIRKTTQEKPENATQWSTRSLARAVGVSESSVRRVWHAHGLKLTAANPSSLVMIRDSPKSSKTSSAYISTHHSTRSCFRWTRKVKFKRWTERNPVCR